MFDVKCPCLLLYSTFQYPKVEIEQKKHPQLPKYAFEGPLTNPFTPVNRNTDQDQKAINGISKTISVMFDNFLKMVEQWLQTKFIKSTIKQHNTDMLDESSMIAIWFSPNGSPVLSWRKISNIAKNVTSEKNNVHVQA